jgi:hypothetical protein
MQEMITKFMDFCQKRIKQDYVRDEVVVNSWDIILESFANIRASTKTVKEKATLIKALDQAIEQKEIESVTETFIKREVTFGTDWPRVISARKKSLRCISSVIYKALELQVYKSDKMTKGKNDR